MIFLIFGVLVALYSFFKMFCSSDALSWVSEGLRLCLSFLIIGFYLIPEWSSLVVVIDAIFVLTALLALRAQVQAEGGADE